MPRKTIEAIPIGTRQPGPEFKAARKKQRRNFQKLEGKCPYCGKEPMPGKTACYRCFEMEQERGRVRRAKEKAAREKALREAAPRECTHCGSENLGANGSQNGRKYYRCKSCRRCSFGDPSAPPEDRRCPYCKKACVKDGRDIAGKQVYYCTACKRHNTGLWPADTISPGGPFPYFYKFLLDPPALNGLQAYVQKYKMSEPQALRDIFIKAQVTSRPRVTIGRRLREPNDWGETLEIETSYLKTAPITIPPGGVRFPDLRSESAKKLNANRSEGRCIATVCVVYRVNVHLNNAALIGLLMTMRYRNLNHQEAVRALCAEAR